MPMDMSLSLNVTPLSQHITYRAHYTLLKYAVEKPWVNILWMYDDATCEDVATHFYNLERLHVVGLHKMCGQEFTSLAAGAVLVLLVAPLMNMRAFRTIVRG